MADTLGSLEGLQVLRDLIALDTSRVFEDSRGKMYMRFTVLIMDLLVYFSVIWILAPRLIVSKQELEAERQRRRIIIMALVQPAIILIDHGHFQYNTVSLGLALWSFHFMTLSTNPFTHTEGSYSFVGPIIGSIIFSLALNFKQMELYHAPAVFAYLLGRCFSQNNEGTSLNTRIVGAKFCALGITVITTFALLWFPFAIYPRGNEDTIKLHIDGLTQVIKRLFPFERGLFEGKVSNLWCALSVKPFSIRSRISEEIMPLLALGLTLLLIMPPCLFLFGAGRSVVGVTNCETTMKKEPKSNTQKFREDRDLKMLLWGSAASSLAFFLASFQVHEKGILIAVAPLSLLILDAPGFTTWFSIVATWTLWPLVIIDRLSNAYACCIVIFICIHTLTDEIPSDGNLDVFKASPTKYIVPVSATGMMLLHIAELWFSPPPNLPDLFPVLWSIVGCGLFAFSYLVIVWVIAQMSYETNRQRCNEKHKRASTGKKGLSILGIGLTLISLPATDAFTSTKNIGMCPRLHLSCSKPLNLFSSDILERARLPLYWETQRNEDAKPVLDLSSKNSDRLSLSDKYLNEGEECLRQNSFDSEASENQWELGNNWLETEHQLVTRGILFNATASACQSNAKLMKSQAMIDGAPQLIRLPSLAVNESANFFMHKQLTPLIQINPDILTYSVDDLYYGIEYLSNMMTRGNETQALQMIQTRIKASPQVALGLLRLGVDGGIDERRVANALGKAATASGSAIEVTIRDAGKTYREFKRVTGRKK